MVEPTLDFNPEGEEDIDIPAFVNENMRFANSEQSGVNPQPQTDIANPANIEGLSKGGNQKEAIEKER